MPRNANTGVYTPPANSWNPAQPDTVISSADWNALRNDLATALNHAPSTTRALHPTTGQVQDGAFVWGGTAGGTANALTLTLTPPITAYAPGMVVRFIASADNTSTMPTLSINGISPAVITRDDGSILSPGDIQSGKIYEVLYSGTQWRLTSITLKQTQINEGAQSISGSSVLDLPDDAYELQFVDMAAEGSSVCLPDATLQSQGAAKFTIFNNGKTDFFVRPSRKMLLKNGDFADSAAWTLGTGWSIESGVAKKTPGAASDLSQPLATEKFKTYEITFTVTAISNGSVRVGLTGGGADVFGVERTDPGTYTEILTSDGNTTFVLRADVDFDGSIDNVVCKRHEPNALALVRPKQSVSFSLLSNSTTHGVWSQQDDVSSLPKIVGPAFAPSIITQILHPCCALNDYQVLHFGHNVSNHLYAYVVEYKSTGVTVGTPTFISTGPYIGGALLIEAGKVLFHKDGLRFAFIKGTNVIIGSPVSSDFHPIDKRTFYGGNYYVQMGNKLVVLIGENQIQVVDCSGTTPVMGNVFTYNGPNLWFTDIFQISSNRVVCFGYEANTQNGSIVAIVATISGTNVTFHAEDRIINAVNFYPQKIIQMSNNLYLYAYKPSLTEVSVVAVTVSGTSVTFHTPVSFSIDPHAHPEAPDAFRNELVQKISDTEAVLVYTHQTEDKTLTFAHIKINGTNLTVSTKTLSNGRTHSLIKSRKNKLYFHFLSNNSQNASINRAVYSIEYEKNQLRFRRIRNLLSGSRPIKINDYGFVMRSRDNNDGPINENNTQFVVVSTKTEIEQVFPIPCRLGDTFWPEEITPQKVALYGESLPSGQRLHYLIEGVF